MTDATIEASDGRPLWCPLAPDELCDLMRDAQFFWCLAGGYAIERFVGEPYRTHDDIDIVVLRHDLAAVQEHLGEWELHAADPPGTLRPWRAGETLGAHVHDIWARRKASDAWHLQIMVQDADETSWRYRRDPRICGPLDELSIVIEGMPSLRPEIQLLYKCRGRRPKDELDFLRALPLLDDDARRTLAAWIETTERAEHPWRAALAGASPAAAASALNRASYDAIATEWSAARVALHGRERDYLDALLEGLPGGAHVLDLGCGTGRPMAAEVIARGYRLTGVDQSEGQLAHARAAFPGERWIASTIEAFATDERFDAVICWDALFHIDRTLHAGLLERFHSLARAGGRIMLTVGGSAHPAFTDTMFERTFFYDSHPPERVVEMLEHAGFEPVIAEFMNPPTSGRDKGRFAIVARRA